MVQTLLALTLFFPGPSDQSLVTLSPRYEAIGKVFKAINPSLKKPLTVSASLQEIPIFIHVNEASESKLREKIATCMFASWEEKADSWLLKKNQKELLIEQKWNDDQFRSALENAITGHKQHYAQKEQSALDDEKQFEKFFDSIGAKAVAKKISDSEYGLAMRSTPKERLKGRIFAKLDPTSLYAARPNARSVFSTAPGKHQLLLKGNFAADTARYILETKILDRLKNKYPGLDHIFGQDIGRASKAPSSTPRPLVIVSRDDDYVSISISLTNESNFDDQYGMMLATSISEATDISNVPSEVLPSFPFSEVSKQYWQAYTSSLDPQKATELFRARLMRPDVFDPFSFGVQEILNEIAEDRNLNIVARIPNFSIEEDSQKRLEKQLLDPNGRVWFQKDGNWLVARPKHLTSSHARQFGRDGLRNALESVRRKGGFSLADQAKLASLEPKQSVLSSETSIIECASQLLWGTSSYFLPRQLRLAESFVSLDEPLQDFTLTIPASYWTLAQRELIESIFFNATPNDIQRSGRDPDRYTPPDPSLAFEPTERFLNGLPATAVLEIKCTVKPTLINVPKMYKDSLQTGTVNLDFVALYLKQERANPETKNLDRFLESQCYEGEETRILLSIRPTPQIEIQSVLRSVLVKSNKPFTIGTMPAKLQKELDRQMGAGGRSR